MNNNLRQKSNFRKMHEARNISLATRFIQQVMNKGINKEEEIRIAKGLYHLDSRQTWVAAKKVSSLNVNKKINIVRS
jgi:hypothetical protein